MTGEEEKIIQNFITQHTDHINELQQVANDFKKLGFREVGEKLENRAIMMAIHLNHNFKTKLPVGQIS